MHFLNQDIAFPDVSEATKEGILAVGGDLSPERLLLAYQSGIFPWFDDEEPIVWWSPDPRFVLFPQNIKVSKSMKQVLRNTSFEVTINKDFEAVISNCALMKRYGQQGTWISPSMKSAYTQLHTLGYAISVEVWLNNELVGGLYGIDVGNGVFCGESMFSKVSNASKVALIIFIQNSNYKLIDCQVYTNHLDSLGAEDMPRAEFMTYLK
ncbi:leucyl/phenylalanyl-tRNA--protein transferase [uncultured Psychroserpens sp.]|uniref:leucyl/phenylalanyl-tRNA--protein transferase n=1 Tax=uncultured Psychroserpens sp. TaxID=255436 RepID=UPI002638A391|nr:leucyl/phenylalanyl-tRNA--protein transferase [uncultured Psychroserpens sp.]